MKLVVKELSTRSAKAARAAEATGGRAALVFSGQSVPTVVFQHLCGYASPRGDYGALMATTRAVMSTLGGTPRLWRRALDASPPGREPKRGRGDAAPEAALSRHRVPRGRSAGVVDATSLAGGNDSFRPACGRGSVHRSPHGELDPNSKKISMKLLLARLKKPRYADCDVVCLSRDVKVGKTGARPASQSAGRVATAATTRIVRDDADRKIR